jgi:hypothetical protein
MFKKSLMVMAIVFAAGGVMGEEESGCAGGVEVRQADDAYCAQATMGGSKLAPAPTAAQIVEWCAPGSRLQIDNIVRITLAGGEVAYLAAVYDPDNGRNFQHYGVLVRPMLKKVRPVFHLGHKFEVFDHDIKGASGIWTEGCGSGQGTTNCTKTALYFDEWKAVVLHESRSGNNLGQCGEREDNPCGSTSVQWTFLDLNGDGKADLMELVINKSRPRDGKPIWKTKTNVYLLAGEKLVQVPEEAASAPVK